MGLALRRSDGLHIGLRGHWLAWLLAVTTVAVMGGALPGRARADQFTQPSGSPFPAGTQPAALALGDFNGDGNLDLAAANQDAGTVTALLGYGTGEFATLAATPVGAGPTALAAGDFSGDGLTDLAVADGADNDIRILLASGNGYFTLAPGSPIPVGARPVSIASADFTGLGTPDLAVANFDSGTVSVLLGDGKGDFTEAPGVPIPVNTPIALVTGDFNRDGYQDLAVVDEADDSVQVLLGTGNGQFTPPPGGALSVGSSPSAIVTADFNRDGIPDLAVLNRADGTASVLLGNGDGSFTQAPGSPIAIGGVLSALAVGDFNGDGIPDLAASDSAANTVTILYGNGDGSLTAASATEQVGTAPDALAVGDFNSDSVPDLAVANLGDGTLTMLLDTVAGAVPCDACQPPSLAETVDLFPLAGSVRVELPHRKGIPGRFIPLRSLRLVPMGTIVDTSRGTVRLSTASVQRNLPLQSADLSGTTFQLSQQRQNKGLTTLQLVSPNSMLCRRPIGGAFEARGRARSVLATLHASAHGHFSTRTHQSAATVRGTRWDTVERCDGTLTRVLRGVVTVRDFRLRRTVVVRAGHSYLARR